MGEPLADELRALYTRKKELLEKFDIQKDSGYNKQMWEALSASERARMAKWFFDHYRDKIEEIEGRIEELEGDQFNARGK